jgi:hypothetical protein
MAELYVPVHPGGAAGCRPAAAQLEAPELLRPQRPRDPDGLRLSRRLGKQLSSSFYPIAGCVNLLIRELEADVSPLCATRR